MFRDLVVPKNNEGEFLELAKKLNIPEITFCYPVSHSKSLNSCGVIAEHNEIKKISNRNTIVLCSSNKREVFENTTPLLVYGLEGISSRDSMHTRHSGINHILAGLAHKNEHTIGFFLSSLLNTNGFSIRLGRMMQNVRLCRKYKIKMKIASFAKTPYQMRSAKDMESLGYFLGMNSLEVKRALEGL